MGLIFIGRIRNSALRHAPSRFSFDQSENLFLHGAWDVEVHEANQSSIRKMP